MGDLFGNAGHHVGLLKPAPGDVDVRVLSDGHFSVATGACAIGIFWPGIEVNNRGLTGLAIPVRVS